MIRKHDGLPYQGSPDDLVVTKLRMGVVRKAHPASKAEWIWRGKPACGQITAFRMAVAGDAVE